MLENKIQELIDAIKELTATFKGAGKPAKQSTPVAETPKTEAPATAPSEKKDEKPKKEKASPEKLKPIQERVQVLVKAGKQEDVKKVLSAVGATTIPSIPVEHLESVLTELNKISTEAPSKKEPEITSDDVLAVAKKIVEKGKDSDEVKALQTLLKKYDAAKVSLVPKNRYAEFLPELKAILEGKVEATEEGDGNLV